MRCGGPWQPGEAVLDGKDLRLLAPIVNLFFTEGRIERLMARRDAVADSIAAEMAESAQGEGVLGRGAPHPAATELGLEAFPRRPYALAQDFILEGDSVEVLAPGEVLEEVWAMGSARGESMGRDSLNTAETLPLIARDWLEGDTIVAFFDEKSDSLAAPDQPLLEARSGRGWSRFGPGGLPVEAAGGTGEGPEHVSTGRRPTPRWRLKGSGLRSIMLSETRSRSCSTQRVRRNEWRWLARRGGFIWSRFRGGGYRSIPWRYRTPPVSGGVGWAKGGRDRGSAPSARGEDPGDDRTGRFVEGREGELTVNEIPGQRKLPCRRGPHQDLPEAEGGG